MSISFFVPGVPQPQGSSRAFTTKTGRAYVTSANAKLKPWREAVRAEAFRAAIGQSMMTNPVAAQYEFIFLRPKSRKKFLYPSVRPDLDKLVRAVNDALTDAGVIKDDALIVRLHANKLYTTDPAKVGVSIQVEEWEDDEK